MKPLLMLDQVMLWLAKLFTAGLLILFGFTVVIIGYYFLIGLYQYLAFPRTAIGTSFYAFNLSLQQTFESQTAFPDLQFSIFIFACVRFLQSIYARICLGLSSGFWVIWFGPLVLFHTRVFEATYWLGLLGFVGFTSLLWVSIRPPQDNNSPFSDLHTTPSFQSA